MKKYLVLFLLLSAVTWAQVRQYPPSFSKDRQYPPTPMPTPTPIPFPAGITEAWLMEEAPTADRVAQITSPGNDLTYTVGGGGADMENIAGENNFAARANAGDYLERTIAPVPDTYTISMWFQSSAAQVEIIGNYGAGIHCFIAEGGNVLTCTDLDLLTGGAGTKSITFDSNPRGTGWIHICIRIDYSGGADNYAGSFRLNGAPDHNGTTYSLIDDGSWDNKPLNVNFRFGNNAFASVAGDYDEVYYWNTLLSDDQCDNLASVFYSP